LLDACARLTAALLEGCPHLRVLATSRQSLGIGGEMVWPVSPLTEDEAVRLFVERGRAADRVFALTEQNAAAVVAICRRLDGLPLAIELAASRLGALGVEQIARRLDDRFRLLNSGSSTALPRHQTLRAALGWSFELLSAAERTLLCRLSVFVGNWTLAAAEAVVSGQWAVGSGQFGGVTGSGDSQSLPAGHCLPPTDVLDLLTQLVDKSLVVAEGQAGEKRYRLLETVREYAAAQISEEERKAWTGRHAGYYLSLAEQAAPLLSGPEQSVGQERLEREQENLRAALAWALTSGEEEAALRLGAALWRFWWLQGYLREGRDRLAEVLALPSVQGTTAARAQALQGAGRINDDLGDWAAAMRLTTQSLVAWQQVGDPYGIADALNQLGDLELYRNEFEAAQARFEGALALCRELDDRFGIAQTLYNLAQIAFRQAKMDTAEGLLVECERLCRELNGRTLFAAVVTDHGWVALARGDVTRARAFFEKSLGLRRELGMRHPIAWSLLGVTQTARLQNDLEAARSAAEEALAICRQLDNSAGIGWALNELADVVYSQGEIEAAAALCEESLAVAQKLGNTRGIGGLLTSLGRVALRRGDTDGALTRFTEALALQQQVGYRLGEAWALEGLAEVTAAREQPEQATRLLAAAECVWEQLPGRLPFLDPGSTELLLARLHSSLGDEAFTAVWESGRTLSEPHQPPAGNAGDDPAA
jgi:predicted ATPase